jgi:predicted GNAT family acetyltransferase
MDLIFKHKEEENKGSFLFYDEEKMAAEMTYSKANGFIIIIDHTSVEAAYRNRDLGYRLVDKVVEFARDHKIKVMPLCPFAASVFQKNEDIRDVLK